MPGTEPGLKQANKSHPEPLCVHSGTLTWIPHLLLFPSLAAAMVVPVTGDLKIQPEHGGNVGVVPGFVLWRKIYNKCVEKKGWCISTNRGGLPGWREKNGEQTVEGELLGKAQFYRECDRVCVWHTPLLFPKTRLLTIPLSGLSLLWSHLGDCCFVGRASMVLLSFTK